MATSDSKKLKTTEETNQDNVQAQPQEPVATPQAEEQEGTQQNPSTANEDVSVNDGSPGREQPTQPEEGVGGDRISNA